MLSSEHVVVEYMLSSRRVVEVHEVDEVRMHVHAVGVFT